MALEFILRGLKVSYGPVVQWQCLSIGGGMGTFEKVIDKLIFRVRFLVLKGYSDLLFITELIGMIH